ncbi:DUF1205 domain-containing protein [Crossiella sp. SN42]|uniref:nucleotide disphospho-sugar-binding domain-containing protein n=1 Tax=Crossiella sp. SN42 TaxID=2944808 RepID=UPI00207C7BD2|nr:nucleotide disphospho-sugar-binding domain-containing protein [Crossiella sp. SN42]MCO1580350.1 DUF1205 domain-containing protein [Crossiella sp. SN42]
MRVLCTTWDMSGHLNPMVPLGWALRAAGHEVLVACAPHFAPVVTAAGLPALPVGPEFDSFAELARQVRERGWQPSAPVDRDGDPTAPQRIRRRGLLGHRVGAQAAAAQAAELVDFARQWRPDLVVFEPTGFAGPLVASLLDIPAVRHLWSVDLTAPVAEFAEDLVGELWRQYTVDSPRLNGDRTLDPCPAQVQVADELPREPIRFVPYNGPSVLPDWLLEPPERPRVCVTWGTSLDRFGFGHLVHAPRVVAALADSEVELVLAMTESQRALFGELPANVRFLGPVPLHLLLPTCAAVVHQGGAGGTMTALVNGVPQLVVADMPDGVFHGRQLARGGVGRTLAGEQATVPVLRDQVHSLLSEPGYRQAAAAARADMLARPSPLDVVADLEKLAAR